MVDEIYGSVDISVQLFDDDDSEEEEEQEDTTCSFNDQDQTEKNEGKKIPIVRIPEYRLNARPLYCIQKGDIKIIQQKFKEQDRHLLKTYKSNAMYSCTMNEFKAKISTFMVETNAYSLIEEFNQAKSNYTKKHLDHLVDKVTTMLDDVLQHQSITSAQYQEMKIIRSKVQLDYLFFLPDTRKDEVSVQPIIISCESPFINISRLLNRLLEPIYDQIALNHTFFQGADTIQALETYTKQGYLRSTTLFATLYIKNILTIFPQQQALEILERFLYDNVPSKVIQGISISTIIQLVRFILDNQWFIYDNKLYQQIYGGGSGSSFILLLVNIILFDWQKDFVAHLKDKHEVYGRCFDEIFLTWNKSQCELQAFIHTMNKKHPYIQIQSTIGTELDYLDASIRHIYGENENEIELETQVYHESKAEPYALPYIYDCPSDIYSKLIRAALIRAARCCSDIYEFQQERHYIELSFTINNFSPDFINEYVKAFFLEFNMEDFEDPLYCEEIYDQIRQNVIKYDQRRVQIILKRHQQAHDYNLQYISLSSKKPFFRYLKKYGQRHRKRSYGSNHSKFYFDIVGRPRYPSNIK